MVLLLKNLQNLQFFYEQTKIKHLINILNLPVRNNWRKWKKKADNLPIANSFLISKLKRIQKNWKPSLQVMANICQSKQISKALCTCNKVMQSETFSPSSTCKNARWEINYTQHVQFSIKRNKPWKSPLDNG